MCIKGMRSGRSGRSNDTIVQLRKGVGFEHSEASHMHDLTLYHISLVLCIIDRVVLVIASDLIVHCQTCNPAWNTVRRKPPRNIPNVRSNKCQDLLVLFLQSNQIDKATASSPRACST